MLPYYIVTIPIALMAVMTPMNRRVPFLWGTAFVVVVVFVGLRHHVGMDWSNYLFMIRKANIGGWLQSFNAAEPGYSTLLWIAGQNNWGIYGAYFMGTLIFAAGLFRYAKITPAPWIALLVAMPYLVIVVSMSAARQAVAAGILLWILAEWSRASVAKRTVFILLASSFHFSASMFYIFIFLDLRIPIWAKSIGGFIAFFVMLYILNSSGAYATYSNIYINNSNGSRVDSKGAIFHAFLNGGPALVYFFLGRRARAVSLPNKIHKYMAILAILLIPLSLFLSTAASRTSIYLFPVSMYFFASFPLIFHESGRTFIKFIIASLFLLILVAWLNFANNARAHQFYQNLIFIPTYDRNMCCN